MADSFCYGGYAPKREPPDQLLPYCKRKSANVKHLLVSYTYAFYCTKGVEIIEAQACPDHIHMLISIPPKYSVSQIMGYLKGKSSLMIFDRHVNLKYKYGNRHFWARGYFVDTVGKNKKAIKAYIQNQIEEDKMSDQISIKEYTDPFTGNRNTKA